MADPPWPLKDKLPGKKRGAVKHYDLLSVEEICAYPLPPIADDAVLLLWRVSSMVEEAMRVVRAWGFVPKAELVWVKTNDAGEFKFGMGRYVRNCHETCVIATRGKATKLVLWHSQRSVFCAPSAAHSEKPAAAYEIAENVFGAPRVELFARVPERAGWDVYGRESAGNPEAPAATSGA